MGKQASSFNYQETHYDNISDDYASHYFDSLSMKYRREFIYGPLFEDIDLNGKFVADLACGDGSTSLEIKRRFPHAHVRGFDISGVWCAKYQEKVGEKAYKTDLTSSNFTHASEYDCAVVIGGLHHCVADLDQTIRNIMSLLKPGGVFLVMEPNAEYAMEGLRKTWYKFDRFFDSDNERALSIKEIDELMPNDTILVFNKYFGGPAYFLILNSLIFRIS
ncbi:MAG: class I SAM-dependent methyltransferase, partial [Pseudomonadota bacterium]